MKIVFFNHYHNGDIFASKGYVADLIKEFKGYEVIYQHFNSSKLLRDLNVEFKSLELPLGPFTDRIPYLEHEDSVYINTWIGNHLSDGGGINWNTYHNMFKKIYSTVSNIKDRSIDLGSVEYYIPEIEYEYFDIPNINIPKDSVIISNGPVLSGQSDLSDINKVIQSILDNTNRTVILTHFAPFNSERVAFTNNLINTVGGDLNEIAWISDQCEYIIGRNSGPFCFMTNKKTLNDANKKIISIGNNEKDSFVYNVKIKAKYNFVHDDAIDEIIGLVK